MSVHIPSFTTLLSTTPPSPLCLLYIDIDKAALVSLNNDNVITIPTDV